MCQIAVLGKFSCRPVPTGKPLNGHTHAFLIQAVIAMYQNYTKAGNVVLLRAATLWLLVALGLAWCLVAVKLQLPLIPLIFKDFDRLLQGHLDFLIMSALLFGFYAANVPLPWHVSWAMAVGAFTNSSLFVLQSIFPELNPPSDDAISLVFRAFSMLSVSVTTYGFGRGAMMVFWATRPQN